MYWLIDISNNQKYTHPLLVISGYVRLSGEILGVVEATHSSRSNTRGWWACWLTPAQIGTKDPSGNTLDSAGPLKSSGKKIIIGELLLEQESHTMNQDLPTYDWELPCESPELHDLVWHQKKSYGRQESNPLAWRQNQNNCTSLMWMIWDWELKTCRLPSFDVTCHSHIWLYKWKKEGLALAMACRLTCSHTASISM